MSQAGRVGEREERGEEETMEALKRVETEKCGLIDYLSLV